MSSAQTIRFEVIFSRYSANILGYLLRRTEAPEDAADLMSEVFATAWRRIGSVPDGEEAKLWLYGIARNVLANHRRGSLRRNRLADRLREHLSSHPDAEPVAAAEGVRAALAQLSDSDRELLTLTVWEQLTPAEIATLLDLESTTVRTRLARARTRLRRVLEAQTHTTHAEAL
ncbi:MAG: polymerase subunit sigma-24 [Actinomycetia bacterium]|nr:polymerase subunit sigma-24 [Actinomycetes bacterium]